MEIKQVKGVYFVLYRKNINHATERTFWTGPTLSIALQRALISTIG